MARAFVFPGQGSQAVGMGKELAAALRTARDVLAEVDEALKQNLSKLMAEGPEAELTLTENAQPALMAVSVAVARVIERDGAKPLASVAKFVAGHSLGEYSALCAAGAIPLGDAARLLKARGRAMQEAVPVGVGAMAALLGASPELAREVAEAAREGEVCDVANDNAEGQVVVSGHKSAVERAIKLAAEKGIRKSILLPVSAPFHCALMKPAALRMQAELDRIEIRPPAVPVVANVTAQGVDNPATVKRLLIEQIPGLVRWRESVLWMKGQGVDALVELGAGKVLAQMTKRIAKDMSAVSVGTPAEIEALLKTL
ncbi:MAG: ACP S-malonyltransferase [Alphaproteobacteria bacterium]|nr:ACP S-malonyltransferase [Alphaproteobacteria bacterium]